MYGPFLGDRPTGLRRRSLPTGSVWWRIDPAAPGGWEWDGFPTPRFRFDPASGSFRVRYAGETVPGAAREKYLDDGRLIPADHAGFHLARLEASRPMRILDLRTEANLDALDVDDRISTSHDPAVWEACHRLADAVRGWWPDGIDGLVYRSRTTPQTSMNLAFFSTEPFAVSSRVLSTCTDELDALVIDHGFTVTFPY